MTENAKVKPPWNQLSDTCKKVVEQKTYTDASGRVLLVNVLWPMNEAQFIGQGQGKARGAGGKPMTVNFQFPIAADTLGEAFDRYDAAGQSRWEEIRPEAERRAGGGVQAVPAAALKLVQP